MILKTFVNSKKIPKIPPLFVNDNFITNFLEKANLFNEFFSKQCQPLQNNSILPKSNTYHTENRLNDITFDNEKLLRIIQSLDANKAHGYDGISVTQPAITCSKLTIETLEQGVKYVQS